MNKINQETVFPTAEEMIEVRKQHLQILKQQRNKLYYEERKNKKIFCSSCTCFVDKYQYDSHLKSQKHGKRLELNINKFN